MATRLTRNVVGSLKGRVLSSQAAASPAEAVNLPKQAPKVTKLPNGMLVASLENNSPVSRVAVVVNAGSRFESGDNLGTAHCLRALSGLSTQNMTSFKIARSLQQVGANLSCTSTRDYMYYSVECLRNNSNDAAGILQEITTNPSLKPWEVSDAQPQLSVDLAILNSQPNVKVYELLHQAAFRNTLGRSLYCPEFMIGKYSSEQLLHYMKNLYTGGRMALVGAGMDHDDLVAQAKLFNPFSGSAVNDQPSAYFGGEVREHTASNLTYATVAVEGASLSGKEALHAAVLQQVMGTGPYVKYSSNTAVSKLGQAASKAASHPFAVSCVNANYSDGGLFGFSAVAQPEEIGAVLRAAFGQFAAITKGNITDQDVARAKNQVKMAMTLAQESQQGVVSDLAEQALGSGSVASAADAISSIDAISTNDVVGVAKRMVNGKASMAAVGDLSKTPYLDELYK